MFFFLTLLPQHILNSKAGELVYRWSTWDCFNSPRTRIVCPAHSTDARPDWYPGNVEAKSKLWTLYHSWTMFAARQDTLSCVKRPLPLGNSVAMKGCPWFAKIFRLVVYVKITSTWMLNWYIFCPSLEDFWKILNQFLSLTYHKTCSFGDAQTQSCTLKANCSLADYYISYNIMTGAILTRSIINAIHFICQRF